jgi:diphthamide synthase (EF-2-diphthine--ammonia ligase)
MATAFGTPPLDGIVAMASGDLFLEDVRAYREERLAAAGKDALFPLWGRDTMRLAHEFVEAGFEAVVCCLDPRKLDPSFAGRSYDVEFLADLPEDVDPCGERGEFHTFVHAGPVLAAPVDVWVGETVERDGFVFCDLVARDG